MLRCVYHGDGGTGKSTLCYLAKAVWPVTLLQEAGPSVPGKDNSDPSPRGTDNTFRRLLYTRRGDPLPTRVLPAGRLPPWSNYSEPCLIPSPWATDTGRASRSSGHSQGPQDVAPGSSRPRRPHAARPVARTLPSAQDSLPEASSSNSQEQTPLERSPQQLGVPPAPRHKHTPRTRVRAHMAVTGAGERFQKREATFYFSLAFSCHDFLSVEPEAPMSLRTFRVISTIRRKLA